MDNLCKISYIIIYSKDAFMYKSIIKLFIITHLTFSQEMPGAPTIAWMPDEFTIIDSSIFVELSWDMWWGENGNYWRLISNNENIYETAIHSETPNPQSGSYNIEYGSSGEYSLEVQLCNTNGMNELCNSSNVVSISVSASGGGENTEPGDIGNGDPNWGSRFFAPFVDATGWPPFDISQNSIETGIKHYALGFIVDKTGDACEASWGGFFGLDGWTYAHDFMFPLIEDNKIGELRNLGGDVMPSIGGAANTPLASACINSEDLSVQYQSIIDAYDLTHLDFDIEGIWVLDNDATIRRSLAIAQVQNFMASEDRPLNIWYTLPVLPVGLTADGYYVVEQAITHGVELSGVNIMAMDYGYQAAPNPEGQMGEYAIQSATSLYGQLTEIYANAGISKTAEEIWNMIGVTPMIGMNDVTAEIFDLDDAEQLRQFGLNQNLGMLSMWSSNRDQQCEEGIIDHVDISCSSILQMPFEFSTTFNDFSENQVLVFDKNIIGYFVSWGIYARDYDVMDIPVEKINVINYAFANINPNLGIIELGDPYADIDKAYPGDCWDVGCLRGNFHQLQLLKEENPHLKTLISIGGWTWSTYFSDIALTIESREIFAQSCVDFMLEYGFDGIDLDWEYPIEGGLDGNHHDSDDDIHLVALAQRLRELLNEQTTLDGYEYLLTIASSANPNYMDNLSLDSLVEYLDWINIMSYDFHGPWSGDGDPGTNFNSPLFATDADTSPEPYATNFNLAASVQNYIVRGVPREKLNAGLAFYGRAYGNVENTNNGLYADYDGVADDGTWEDGFYDYWDLSENYIDMVGYDRFWQDEAKVPWLYNTSTQIMISYDDEASIQAKAEYIISENLGGGMFWEFSGDKDSHLLNVINEVFNNYTENDCTPGDINGDSILNVLDVVILVNSILSEAIDDCGDLNGDESLDVLDIVLLVNIIITTEI